MIRRSRGIVTDKHNRIGCFLAVCLGQYACHRAPATAKLDRSSGAKTSQVAVHQVDASSKTAEVAAGSVQRVHAAVAPEPAQVLTVACDSVRGIAVLFRAEVSTLRSALGVTDGTSAPNTDELSPGEPPFDCALGINHETRLKLGVLPPMPYGFCGADPEAFVSIWVDKTKIVSARNYTGLCMQDESPLAYVRVTSKSIRWCTAKIVDGKRSPNLKCTVTRVVGGAKTADDWEFPPPGKTTPEPGTILLDYAEDPALCAEIAAHRAASNDQLLENLFLPPTSSKTELFRESPSRDQGLLRRGQIDLDNDGQTDDVLWLQTLAHARDNDEFLIARAHQIAGEVDPDEYERLRRLSRSVIPASWATAETRYEGPLYSVRHLTTQPYRHTGVGAASAGARHRQLRLQYLHLQPFVHEGTTYLLSASPSWALSNEDTFVLFRPRPSGPPDEVCVFHQVQPNF